MRAAQTYTDREIAIDACGARAVETQREQVLMSYMDGSALRYFVVSRTTFNNAPVPSMVQVGNETFAAGYEGWMFGKEGRI